MVEVGLRERDICIEHGFYGGRFYIQKTGEGIDQILWIKEVEEKEINDEFD